MAAALFAVHARRRGAAPDVLSAGTDAGRASMPDAPPREVHEVMAPYGIDLHAHHSRALSGSVLLDADLVIGMARRHVQESVLLDPPCFTRAFTLRELVRRGNSIGARPVGEELDRWIGAAHGDRTRVALARRGTADDIADPYGGPLTAYRDCALELDALTGVLAALLWPAPER
jgi:protein arginine phosphatase